MRLSSFTNITAMLYEDTMDVYRYSTVTDPETGVTSTSLDKEPVYTGERCRLSFGPSFDQKRDSYVDEDPIQYGIKLFCKPHLILLADDYIVVHRNQDGTNKMFEYRGHIGQPGYYSNHIESIFGIDESS